MTTAANIEQEVTQFVDTFEALRQEVSKLIVGQQAVVEEVLTGIICGGHVLLEGVPGLGKTALVRTISEALHCTMGRVQFTPDLLPSDIVGTNILVERDGRKVFEFQPGPVFHNILLADEINRATPKTQSALLETMQEKSVTVGGVTHALPAPFFVLATQNPIENDGTYALPEAQLDRFMAKIDVQVPSHDEFDEILRRTTGNHAPVIQPVTDGQTILAMGRLAREVPIADALQRYLVKLVRATHPSDVHAPEAVKKNVRHGASPRGAQALLAAARVRALLGGRVHVSSDDIRSAAKPTLCVTVFCWV